MIRREDLRHGDELVYQGDNDALERGVVYHVAVVGDRVVVGGRNAVEEITPDALAAGHWTRFIQQRGGWIGVDFDGTLAVYDGWKGPYDLGPPIPAMVKRVRAWLTAGRDVRIFTARVTDLPTNADGSEHDLVKVRAGLEAWCLEHLGRILPITNVKDWHLMELWDDRAVQVRPNTGITLADELEAIKNADSGKVATA